MQYRNLGRSGLQVSELSLGSWVTYAAQVNVKQAKEMLALAMDSGVNFFDNAEVYASGKSEEVMGDAIKALKWPRLNYIVSTKFYWGLGEPEAKSKGMGKGKNHPATSTVNRKNTLNRKYLMQAIDGSLKRMGLDFIVQATGGRVRGWPCGPSWRAGRNGGCGGSPWAGHAAGSGG